MGLGKGTLTVALTKSTAPKAGKMYLRCLWKTCFDGRWKILAIALKAEMTLIPSTLLSNDIVIHFPRFWCCAFC